jgi:hypothetical protein
MQNLRHWNDRCPTQCINRKMLTASIFITVVSDTRSFLTWLRASCPGGLTDQLKSENLTFVPSTADGIRALVSELWSLDGKEGVRLNTFTPPDDGCLRLLVKNLSRRMPESIIRDELMSRDSCRCDLHTRPAPHQGLPSHPHFIVSVARGPDVSKVRSLAELRGLRMSVESYVAPKGPLQCQGCQRFGHTQRNCEYAPRCIACGVSHLSGGCCTPREQPQCCG